jgi:hypothetical protein
VLAFMPFFSGADELWMESRQRGLGDEHDVDSLLIWRLFVWLAGDSEMGRKELPHAGNPCAAFSSCSKLFIGIKNYNIYVSSCISLLFKFWLICFLLGSQYPVG